MRFVALLFFALVVAPALAAAAPKTLVTCKTGADGKSTFALLGETRVDGTRLSLKLTDASKTPPQTTIDKAFTDMPSTDFVGDLVMAKCVEGVLVFALDYGTPYRKGVAVRMRKSDNATQRIDFAEKALPKWLYSNARDLSLVIPNLGGESNAKFLHYVAEADLTKSQTPKETDRLPPKNGFIARPLR